VTTTIDLEREVIEHPRVTAAGGGRALRGGEPEEAALALLIEDEDAEGEEDAERRGCTISALCALRLSALRLCASALGALRLCALRLCALRLCARRPRCPLRPRD
jgi:hypothetical protein